MLAYFSRFWLKVRAHQVQRLVDTWTEYAEASDAFSNMARSNARDIGGMLTKLGELHAKKTRCYDELDAWKTFSN